MRVSTTRRIFTSSLIAFLISPAIQANEIFNMTPGVTPVSHDVFHLHMIILSICTVIGALVFAVMLYALIKHRKARGHVAKQFHESTKVEILWTVIPFLILVGMAFPATIVVKRIKDTTNPDLSIRVTGFQWKWKYDYLDDDISFISALSTPPEQMNNLVAKGEHYLREVDNPLIVPVNKKIRFVFTADDVIHSWWVPALGFKKDAVPGFINENWAMIEEPGTYRGGCAELCGVGHGFMPIVVKAVSNSDYQTWVSKTKAAMAHERELMSKEWTLDELMSTGKAQYEKYCAACHHADGSGMPPMFPPLAGSKVATGPVTEHIQTVLFGRPGTAMQGFSSQLSENDIAAIITYERNAWGNNTGDAVQPSTVYKIKQANNS